MRGTILATALLLIPLLASQSIGATTTETFEGGTNAAGWTYGFDSLDNSGGNPGWWLHAVGLDTFGPRVANDPAIASPFSGNLRTKGVTAMSIDSRIDSTDFPIGGDA